MREVALIAHRERPAGLARSAHQLLIGLGGPGGFPDLSELAGVATPTRGQETKPSAEVEAGAVAALERMGAYLRSLKAFRVVTQSSTEEVLDNGVKVTFGGKSDLLASMPNRLRAEVVSEQQERLYLYDGQSFTLFAPGPGYYATVPAPAAFTL